MKNFLFFLLMIPLIGYSQKITVSGTVNDKQGSLYSVSVYEKGTLNGTTSDFEGTYQLDVAPNSTLVFSFIGYKTQEIVVGESSKILDVKLVEDNTLLDEIVVTGFETVAGKARKRRENIQETPEAVTALSAKDLEATGANNIETVALRIPNVSFNDYQDEANFTINVRGITQVRDGEAPVSIVIDDVQLPFHQQINQDFLDIEHIEVVKGPQGTLYGKNAIGGAINIITKRPTNSFHGFVKAEYGTGNRRNAAGVISGPIVQDRIFFRLGGGYTDFDGFSSNRNTFLNKNTDFKESKSLRGQLQFRVTPKFNIDVKGQYYDSEAGALYYLVAKPKKQGESAANVFEGNPRGNLLGTTSFESMDFSGKLSYSSNFGKFLSITNYSEIDYYTFGDLDHTPSPLDPSVKYPYWQSDDAKLKGFNQEFRFVSDFDTKFSMIGGLFYQNNKRDQVLRSEPDTVGKAEDIDAANGKITGANLIDSRTMAAFGHFGYKFTDALELTAGLRYDMDHREQTDASDINQTNKRDYNQLQPKVGLSYKIKKGTIVFVNYAEGYRSGGFNPVKEKSSLFLDTYKKEVTKNVELGFKSSWWNNRIIFNTNLFRTVFDNEQVYVVDLTSYKVGLFNIDEVVNYGSELEFKIRPVKNLDLGLSYGYIDSEIKKADIASQFKNKEGESDNWEGNKAPFVSTHNFLVSASYKLDLNEDNNITFYTDFANNGKFYWHPDNVDVQKPYSITNFKVTYGLKDFKIGVFGNNIFNTKYNTEYFSQKFSTAEAGDLRFPSNPANYGVDLRYKF